MKQKYFYLLLLLQFFIFGNSQTLDQANAPSGIGGGSFTISPSQNAGQSFTAGVTGDLTQINIRIGNWGGIFVAGDFQLRIFDGNGYGGTVLNSTTFTINSAPVSSDYQELVIPLSSSVPIASGSMYTIDLRGITGAVSTHGANPDYVNGGLYFSDGNNLLYNSYDLWFKTFVNVPTPATHLNFDGSNDFVDLGNTLTSTLNGANFFTVEAWVYTPSVTGTKTIVGNHISNGAHFNLRIINDRLNGFLGFGAYDLNSAAGTIVANTWQHVAMVYNDTTLKLYIDGTEVASMAIPAAYSLQNTIQPYRIGASGYGGEYFNGNIDDVRIWNVVKTPDQLAASKNCELLGNEPGLLRYYKFNQGFDTADNSAITSATDATANANNGTLTNFSLNGTTSNWLAGSPVTTGSIIPSNAIVTTPVVYGQGDTASAITATVGANGTGLVWYTSATGGTGSTTAPTPSTATVGSTSYWVSSTNANECESARVEIVVNVIVANDECANAISLTVGSNSFNDFPENILLTTATNSGAPSPTCGDFQGGDVWYTVSVPGSGNVVIETDGAGLYDTGLEVYTGSCGTFSLVACDDNSGNGNYSRVLLLGQTPGTLLYVRVWENFFGISNAQFQISAYDYVVPATHLNFDGTNDSVVSANAITSNTGSQTYQAWFRISSSVSTQKVILQRGIDGTGGWSIQLSISNSNRLQGGIVSTLSPIVSGTTILAPNTWYHATLAIENNGMLRLYLNGVEEASASVGALNLRNSDNRLRVGSGNIPSEFFNGDIDEVRVWDVALSATDILATRDCELDNSQTNVVVYYKFNQGFDQINNTAITTATDDSGNSNNGTLTGFTLTGTTSNWSSGSAVTTGNTCSIVLNSDDFEVANFGIYPNPTTGIVNIKSDIALTIEIYDLLGKRIVLKKINSGIENIDITNYPSGIYLLKSTNDLGNSKTYKIIKE